MPYLDKKKSVECKRLLLASRKSAWFAKHGPCQHCGSSENLEVDHIDPSKKAFSINWGVRFDVLEIELNKCQALCGRCHAKKSGSEKTKPLTELKQKISSHARQGLVTPGIKHGTVSSYAYHRCRCQLCRDAINAYARKRTKTQRAKATASARQKRHNPNEKNGYFLSFPIPPRPISHGTVSGYYHHGCRCEICEAFAVEKRRLEREQKAAARALAPARPPLEIRHGTTTAYQHHACRCDICRAFISKKSKEDWVLLNTYTPEPPPRPKPPVVHGSYYTYCKHACRCSECSAVAQEYRDKKKAAAVASGSL